MTAVLRAIICVAITLIAADALMLGASHATPNNSGVLAGTSNPIPAFVGAQACAQCHEREFKLWMGSHHQRAMQTANASTVLGDFNNVAVVHGSITTRFFRSDSKFMVRTDGPDGALHDYPIKFTFGVAPLQQYLLSCLVDAFKLSVSHGTAVLVRVVASDGLICTRIPNSTPSAALCIGRDSARTGTSCVRTAIRLTCARTTIWIRVLLPPPMPRSTSRARLVTGPGPNTLRGQPKVVSGAKGALITVC